MMTNNLVEAMAQFGVMPANPLNLTHSGELQRYKVKSDKPGSKNGWLVNYRNPGMPTVYVFGSWKTGSKHHWIDGGEYYPNSDTRLLVEQAQRQAQLKKAHEQQKVANRCALLWESLQPAVNHPYLSAKDIKPHLAKQLGMNLVLPLLSTENAVCSLQFISPEGAKTFSKGGKVNGCYCPIGNYDLNTKCAIVCEGFATGATIHEATTLPVLVAFNANNLAPVAIALRRQLPLTRIVIAADNDRFTRGGNVGVLKAESAARTADGYVVIPHFRSDTGTDFNDLAQQVGIAAIRAIFDEVSA